MGAQVAHQLAQAGIHHRMKTLAMGGEFGQSAYLAEDLYKKHGLTSAKIVEAAQELMR
jgi:transketolase